MFSALAGMIMAMKVHFNQMKYPVMKRQDRIVAEYLYTNEIDKIGEQEKYKKSKMPQSGYMTREEYEALSRAKTKKEINEQILKEPEIISDANMIYVPQRKLKLVKYNEPVGSPELSLPRKLNFDRQINAQGIISGDCTMLVYPAVYYYAQADCTCCDLFLIKLDTSLSKTERVKKANIVNKEGKPLISTDKDIDTKFIFRTLTPIDFSTDNKKLIVKEKVGHRFDGIWKTDLWVYNFETGEAKKLPQIRDAIVNYWANTGGVDFDEKRWDIYPMGFDADDENRVILAAYAYTGEVPKFLGTWSIDTDGQSARLESLRNSEIPVSIVGYKLDTDDIIPPTQVEREAEEAREIEKADKKAQKKLEKEEKKLKKLEYERRLYGMDAETMLKIKQRKDSLKQLKKDAKKGLTGS